MRVVFPQNLLDGSRLNKAKSIQRVLNRRALDKHPTNPDQIITRFESVTKNWNAVATPFV